MADETIATRVARLEDAVATLRRDFGVHNDLQDQRITKIANQTQLITELQETLQDIVKRITEIEESFKRKETPVRHHEHQFQNSSHGQQDTQPHMRSIRVEVPRFDGANASGWLMKIQNFFDFHHTPVHQRLSIASFHLEGEALEHYQWLHKNHLLRDWQDFMTSIEHRFGDSKYEDAFGKLTKLTQTGTVGEYPSQFEKLDTKVEGVPERALISCWVAGLKTHIKTEVQIQVPYSLVQAMHLARMQEEKFEEQRVAYKSWNEKASTYRSNTFGNRNLPPLLPSPGTKVAPADASKSSSFPVKRLTPSEILVKREKGLCYNCDEKFHKCHRCKGRVFLLLLTDEEDKDSMSRDEEITVGELAVTEEVIDIPAISLHALAG
ncbi:hypothetical protein Patl1_15454 [Pistacia atlantica]|uniref:Uncharacterized protein n=1 Tax=Pistacia atlantica TaxID=434234 RepID=A0ACC1BAQ6_9ROSI|nr:hypothetical protein Patl1_15454 [Pistacia atlantica]